ncbi:MAG: TrmH family RNA methyltransferase, partial [Patescibacteria group bacterium]
EILRKASADAKAMADRQNDGVALVVGNEVGGLPRNILDKCDKILEIPMYGKKESLNVAVAFGIVAFYIQNVILNRR